MKTDFRGLPLVFELTGGEASDSPQFPILLDAGPDIRPRAAMGDKATTPNRTAWPLAPGVSAP